MRSDESTVLSLIATPHPHPLLSLESFECQEINPGPRAAKIKLSWYFSECIITQQLSIVEMYMSEEAFRFRIVLN